MAQNRPRKTKKRSPLYAPLTFIVICLALTLGIGVFFRVSTIEVTGADYYTEQEIIEASGIEAGDNLFFVNTISAGSRVTSRLPYIQKVSVSRKLPNRVIIEVTEIKAAAFVCLEDEYWLLDTGCKLLGSAEVSETEGLISVIGITPSAPVVGETLKTESAGTSAVQYLADLLGAMSELDILQDVTYIDMSNVSDPSFDYLDRFTVKLGSDDAVIYKLELLLSAVDRLGDGDEGLIDLSQDDKAHFSPY